MSTYHLKKMAGGALLAGGVALAGVGLASADAHATGVPNLPDCGHSDCCAQQAARPGDAAGPQAAVPGDAAGPQAALPGDAGGPQILFVSRVDPTPLGC